MKKTLKKALTPLVLRLRRLIDALSKSNAERDFYIDKAEGFIIYVDLDRSQKDLDSLEKELKNNVSRYVLFPKLTSYELRKIIENFIQEKVYDIDVKEKLVDVIQSKDANNNFLEFIYDRDVELDKWLQFYQERMRIYIIEWLRNCDIKFVFEEDLDFPRDTIEKLKKTLFQKRVTRELVSARKTLTSKSKTYYSIDALNPRPKRGRPPKQAVKVEIQYMPSADFYFLIPKSLESFIFAPKPDSLFEIVFSEYQLQNDKVNTSKLSSCFGNTYQLDVFSQKLVILKNSIADVDFKSFSDDEDELSADKNKEMKKITKPKKDSIKAVGKTKIKKGLSSKSGKRLLRRKERPKKSTEEKATPTKKRRIKRFCEDKKTSQTTKRLKPSKTSSSKSSKKVRLTRITKKSKK